MFETQYNIILNNQLAGFKNNIYLWNTAVTFLFMKNDRLQLKLSANDVLKSNVNRYRSIEQNYILDTQTNNPGRFGMIALTYNIQNIGKKAGSRERFFGF